MLESMMLCALCRVVLTLALLNGLAAQAAIRPESAPAEQSPAALAPEPVPRAGLVSEDELRQYWQQRLRDARARVTTALERVEAAESAYRTVRHRRRARGELKQDTEQEIVAARAELAAAEGELAAIPEAARRSGAQPGWLRDVESE